MAETVFFFDVDDTLLDNDRIQADLSAHLKAAHGAATHDRYWAIFERLRRELGYVDYLGALEQCRREDMHNPKLLDLALWLIDYPFGDRLYPGALEAVRRASNLGLPVILSDGDAVFQPLKVERSGLRRLFGDRVLIYIHKEQELAALERAYPARHYVVVDDKLRILAAIKPIWGDRVTTVFVRQGHYARDAAALAGLPGADMEIESIGDFVTAAFPLPPPA